VTSCTLVQHEYHTSLNNQFNHAQWRSQVKSFGAPASLLPTVVGLNVTSQNCACSAFWWEIKGDGDGRAAVPLRTSSEVLRSTVFLLYFLSCPASLSQYSQCFFYRAMHYSAKRGIAIACRLSVCLRRW